MAHQKPSNDPGPERWTSAPLPVDERWLERFTRGFRLRGSEGSAAIDLTVDLDHEMMRQPPLRAAA